MADRFPVQMIMRAFVLVSVLFFTVHCSLLSAFGQSATATLTGILVDEKGGVIPGTQITVLNEATSLRRETTTNESGYFTIPLLPPGTYTLTARREGFRVVVAGDIVLNVNDEHSLRIQLQVGDVKETVNVTGEAPLINESPAVGTVVDRNFAANLPLNGRSFQTLIALAPGVVIAPGDGQFSTNGQRTNANYFTVDGVSANTGSSSTSFLIGGNGGLGQTPSFSALGTTSNLVSPDELQEFKIQTSTYSAEYGRQPGAQVQLATRSGANNFHGSAYEYFRNDALDATDWFVNAQKLRKPELRQNIFGGTFSGPVVLPRFGEGGRQPGYNGRNKTFFFFSYEGLRLRLPQVATNLAVPAMSLRQQAPTALQPLLNAFPVPTGPENTASRTAPFSATYSDPSSQDTVSVKIDQAVGSHLNIFARYNTAPSESTARAIGGPNQVTFTQVNTRTLTVGATWIVSPRVTNELRFNYSRTLGSAFFDIDNFGGAQVPANSVLFPIENTSRNTSLSFFRVLSSSFNVGTTATNRVRQINLVDNLSLSLGNHSVKFGVDYRNLAPVYGPFDSSLSVFFTTPAAVSSSTASLVQIASRETVQMKLYNLSLYAEDEWRVTRRLTLDYGLRWELNPAPQGTDTKPLFTLIGLDNRATIALAPAGTPLYPTVYTNFAPRVGASYLLRQETGRELVLRGGFGMFYDLGEGNAGVAAVGFPYRRTRALTSRPYPLSLVDLAPVPTVSLIPPYVGQALFGFAPDYATPRTYQWNVAAEQSLGKNQTVSVAYVGSAGRNLTRLQGTVLDPNPNFTGNTNINIQRTDAISEYRALQVQFQRRLARGFQALASYTWSRSRDDSSSDPTFTPRPDIVALTSDYGRSDFDLAHNFSSAVTYVVPTPRTNRALRLAFGGWAIDGIATAQSAFPVNVTYSRILAGFEGGASVRPDLVPGVPLYLSDSSVPGGVRVNAAAFSIPTEDRQGNLERNAVRGFGRWQIDLGLRREFKLHEKLKLQFRGEAFNLLNHPNFANPSGNLGSYAAPTFFPSSSFGTTTAMLNRRLGGLNPLFQIGGPRSIQLSMRLSF